MNWAQFQAILWLRWRLTRNRFARAGSFNAVLAFIMLALTLVGGLGAGVVGLLVGALALRGVQPQVLLLVWDGVLVTFLFLWLAGLMVELQRSESIDLSKLLHLPVTLQQVFGLNYVASHLTPSVVLFLPAVVGLSLGLVFGAGVRMVLLLPLALSFFFMLTAWTYCLRGWLTALMVNKRRRRAIIVWVTLVLVLVGQLPNLIFNSGLFRRPGRTSASTTQAAPGQSAQAGLPPALVRAHLAVPPGWVGYGAMALRENRPWPALGGIGASFLLGALGLRRAYVLTLRFYRSGEGGADTRPARVQKERTNRPLLVERRLPGLPDDTAALTLATLRCLLRSPELKMTFVLPIVLVAMLGAMHASQLKGASGVYAGALAGTGVAVVASFCVASVMSNIFGLDRDGFRALMLLPTQRHYILLAKNLAFFPLVGGMAFVLLLVAKFIFAMSWAAFLAGAVQVPVAFLLFCLPCNLVSILVPYRQAFGTLRARKVKPMVFLGMLISTISLPLILLPLLVAPGLQILFTYKAWVPWLPVNLLVSLVLLAGTIALYCLLLPQEGRLLQQREQRILREVTEEVE